MFLTRRRSFASGADLGDDLVERHRIEDQIAAQDVELERRVVDDGAARLEREDVFLRGLRIHRDEEVDFLLPADVAALVRADGVPGRQAGDVRREQVLARHRHAHLEDRAQQDEVRRLAARSVDRGDLDAEVVDDLRARLACARVLRQEVVCSHLWSSISRVSWLSGRPRPRGRCPPGSSRRARPPPTAPPSSPPPCPCRRQ